MLSFRTLFVAGLVFCTGCQGKLFTAFHRVNIDLVMRNQSADVVGLGRQSVVVPWNGEAHVRMNNQTGIPQPQPYGDNDPNNQPLADIYISRDAIRIVMSATTQPTRFKCDELNPPTVGPVYAATEMPEGKHMWGFKIYDTQSTPNRPTSTLKPFDWTSNIYNRFHKVIGSKEVSPVNKGIMIKSGWSGQLSENADNVAPDPASLEKDRTQYKSYNINFSYAAYYLDPNPTNPPTLPGCCVYPSAGEEAVINGK